MGNTNTSHLTYPHDTTPRHNPGESFARPPVPRNRQRGCLPICRRRSGQHGGREVPGPSPAQQSRQQSSQQSPEQSAHIVARSSSSRHSGRPAGGSPSFQGSCRSSADRGSIDTISGSSSSRRNQRQSSGLTREALVRALTQMGQYLQAEGRRVTVITMGGAWQVLAGHRKTTNDFNQVGSNLSAEEQVLLRNVADKVAEESGNRLDTDWFDGLANVWLPPEIREAMTKQAIEEKTTIFKYPNSGAKKPTSLRVLQAPLRFAFMSNLAKIFWRDDHPPYPQAHWRRDLQDAASLLVSYMYHRHPDRATMTWKSWLEKLRKEPASSYRPVNLYLIGIWATECGMADPAESPVMLTIAGVGQERYGGKIIETALLGDE
jgi:hypothetical protein